jgi:hypothetical protein
VKCSESNNNVPVAAGYSVIAKVPVLVGSRSSHSSGDGHPMCKF